MAQTQEQMAVEYLSRAKQILIVTQAQPTTDAVSSALALGLVLRKLNKPFEVVIPGWDQTKFPTYLSPTLSIRPQLGALRALKLRIEASGLAVSEYSHELKDGRLELTVLPESGEYKTEHVKIQPEADRFDLVIAIGCTEHGLLHNLAKGFADFLYRTPIINIDHRVENEFWGQLNLVNPKAAATTEVVHSWLENWNPNFIDEEVATALLAGLISETKSFRTSKVTPRTLEVSSQLARLGARRAEIVTQLWRTRELGVLKLWGRAVTRLVQESEQGIVWTSLSETDFLETGTQVEDLEGVVEELIANVPNAKLTVLFHQRQGKVMAEVHTTASYSAVDVARHFGGQGTRIKAEFELNQAYVEVIDKIKKIVSS